MKQVRFTTGMCFTGLDNDIINRKGCEKIGDVFIPSSYDGNGIEGGICINYSKNGEKEKVYVPGFSIIVNIEDNYSKEELAAATLKIRAELNKHFDKICLDAFGIEI